MHPGNTALLVLQNWWQSFSWRDIRKDWRAEINSWDLIRAFQLSQHTKRQTLQPDFQLVCAMAWQVRWAPLCNWELHMASSHFSTFQVYVQKFPPEKRNTKKDTDFFYDKVVWECISSGEAHRSSLSLWVRVGAESLLGWPCPWQHQLLWPVGAIFEVTTASYLSIVRVVCA